MVASSQAVYGEGTYECSVHGMQYPDLRSTQQLMLGDWDVHCPHCGKPMIPLWTDEARVNPANQYAVSKYCQELYASD